MTWDAESRLTGDETASITQRGCVRPHDNTQAGRILAMLLASEAVCATSIYAAYIPRGAAVVHRLRRAGYVISTQACSRDHYHETHQVEYVLEALPFDPTGFDA